MIYLTILLLVLSTVIFIKKQKTQTLEKIIAQEVEKIIPEVVSDMYEGEYKGIDYIKLVPILIGAIKELNEEINELKNKINYL